MIPLFKPHTPAAIDKPLLETLHSGYITQGPKVDEFEDRVGKFLKWPFIVAVNSGTSSLTLALRLAGVGPGDEVITTPMTCTATNLPVLSLGGKLVFADIDPTTGNISAKSIQKRITKKTKAILFVDWGGTPADLDAIVSIARAHNLRTVEDAAHAFGAEYEGRKIGAICDFTCFSLQAIKHITTGDGGILTCRNLVDYQRAKVLRWFGIDRDAPSKDTRIDQDIEEWGYKFHMNDLNATIGIVQMDYIEKILKKHRANARHYNENLDVYFDTISDRPEESAYWLYTMLLPSKEERDAFKQFAAERDIQVSQVHKRNDEYTVFKQFVIEDSILPGVDHFADRMICIPVHWALTTKERDHIVKVCNEFAQKNRRES